MPEWASGLTMIGVVFGIFASLMGFVINVGLWRCHLEYYANGRPSGRYIYRDPRNARLAFMWLAWPLTLMYYILRYVVWGMIKGMFLLTSDAVKGPGRSDEKRAKSHGER